MDDVVPLNIRRDRTTMLRNLSEKKRRHFYESQLGNQATVLFEEDIEDGMIHGFTENYVRVRAKYDPILVNELKDVVLEEISEAGTVEVSEPEEILMH